ncbi:hypothetical protein [Brevundimonas sp. R86498]|uniref:hypothetical protein n=1 Tax=Brevundimonas sp. R86498 TaxID=3093845 RepID=UPI0037C90D27
MTRPENDWTDLTEAWTLNPDERPPLDAGLIRALRRRDRLARLNFAAEIAGALIVLGMVVWAVMRGLPLPVAGAALIFVLFAVGLTLWSRRGDPGLLTETPGAVLRSALGQARTGYRWALSGVAISLAAMIFVIVMMTTVEPARGPTGSVIAGVGILLLLCIGFYLRHARRCRRRMAAHQAALDALTDREPGPEDTYDRF